MKLGLGLGFTKGGANFNPFDLEPTAAFLADDLANFTFTSGSGYGDPIATWLDETTSGFDLTPYDDTKPFNLIEYGMFGKPEVRKIHPQATLENLVDDFHGTVGTLIFFMSILPNRATAEGNLISLLNSSARVVYDIDTNQVFYNTNQAGGAEFAAGTYAPEDLMMITLRFESLTSAKMRINDQPDISFDPNNNYNNGALRLGALNDTTDGPEITMYGVLTFKDKVLTDSEVSNTFKWGNKRFNENAPRELIAFVGESTIIGERAINSAPAYNNKNRMESFCAALEFEQAVEPAQKLEGGVLEPNAEYFGIAFPMLNRLADYGNMKPVAIMCGKAGSTVADWARNESDHTDDTTIYGAALTQILSAQTKAGKALGGMVLSIGINDAIDATTKTAYKTGLQALVANLREDVGNPNLRVVINTLHKYNSTDMSASVSEAEWNAINDGILEVAQADDYMIVSSSRNIEGASGDIFHLSSTDNSTVGIQLANFYYEFVIDTRPLLDKFTDITNAFSFQDLAGTDYPVATLRRGSDNVESDFTAAEFKDGTVDTWVGAADAFLVRLYNQASPPIGDKRAWNVYGVTLASPASTITLTGDFFIDFKVYLEASNLAPAFCDSGSSTNRMWFPNASSFNSTINGVFNSGSVPTLVAGENDISITRVGSSLVVTVNGVDSASRTVDTGDFQITRIGRQAGGTFLYGSMYDININDQAFYNGYGNTAADWTDQIGSNNATVDPQVMIAYKVGSVVTPQRNAMQITAARQFQVYASGVPYLDGGLMGFNGIDVLGNASTARSLEGLLPPNLGIGDCTLATVNHRSVGKVYQSALQLNASTISGGANNLGTLGLQISAVTDTLNNHNTWVSGTTAGTGVDLDTNITDHTVHSLRRTGGTLGNGGVIEIHGTTSATGLITDSGTQSWNSANGDNLFSIGRQGTSSGVNAFAGNIQTILIADRSYSDNELSGLETQLRGTYSI